MRNSLARIRPAIRSDVEGCYGSIPPHDLRSLSVDELVYCIQLGLTKVEIVPYMSLRDYQRVQGSHGKAVPDRDCKFIFLDNPVRRELAEQASFVAIGIAGRNAPEISRVAITLGRIARVT